jgi:hypothetical protein
MDYTAKTYLKNRDKWGKINILCEEIEGILKQGQKKREDFNKLQSSLMSNIAGKTIDTKIEWGTGMTIVIGKRGIGLKEAYSNKPSWGRHERIILSLRKNKQDMKKLLAKIKKPDKKEIMAWFVKNEIERQGTIKFEKELFKTIIMPNPEDAFKTEKLSVETNEDGDVSIILTHTNKDQRTRNMDIEGNNLDNNMIKEQVYLPCWKLLIKVRRHANKNLKKTSQHLARCKKELEPYWVAHRMEEVLA